MPVELFTSETARQAALKSILVRQAMKEVKAAKAELRGVKAQLTEDVRFDLEIVEEQIAHTRRVLNDKKSFFCPACERFEMQPQHMAQLLKALDSLLDRRRELLGRPRLATLRPSSKPQRRTPESPSPSPSEE
jgi:hypothetical protein